MSDPDAYIMLVSSLPNPQALFLAKRPPLSRLRLDQRLRVLTEEDTVTLKLVEDALDWRLLPGLTADEEVLVRSKRALAEIESETLRLVVRDRMEIRTIISALRRRHRGDAAPAPGTPWGLGRWTRHIVQNWSDPGFRLGTGHAWVREADRLMKDNDTLALERLILELAYRLLKRRKAEHDFDLEAVVMYVLQWSIVTRWVIYNAEVAARRFEDLAEAGMADFVALSFEGDA